MREPAAYNPSSRQAEERRTVSIWLNRLEGLLAQDTELYQSALHLSGLSRESLEDRTITLRQSDLDRVVAQIRLVYPDITLRLFSRAEILDLGLVGYAAVNSDSVGSALQIMNQYHSLASDRYLDELIQEGDIACIAPAPLPGYAEDFENICEDSFSGNWRALQLLLGPQAKLADIKVLLPYAAPAYVNSYFEIFGKQCEFESSGVGLSFPREWLAKPIYRGSGSLSDVYRAMCERVLGPNTSHQDTPSQVRRLLLNRSGRHMPDLESAAGLLRLTPAQLRKRLYRAGTSYKKLVLETRMGLGKQYLVDTSLSIQEIAYLLDYGSPPPFSRAFKKYFGHSPEAYRSTAANSGLGSEVSTKGP